MKTKILNLKNVRTLSKNDQKSINGGSFGYQPQFIPCRSDNDCPCNSCGVTINAGGNPIFVEICAY